MRRKRSKQHTPRAPSLYRSESTCQGNIINRQELTERIITAHLHNVGRLGPIAQNNPHAGGVEPVDRVEDTGGIPGNINPDMPSV